jgi:hypothetical protein
MGERESGVLRQLIDFLIQHGYPARSIVAEYPLGTFRPDITIIDPTTGKPTAFFEVKAGPLPPGKAVRQMAAYAATGLDLPVYLVTPTDRGEGLRIFKYQGPDAPLAEAPVPDFQLLANRYLQEAVKTNREKQHQTTTTFKVVCWILAAITGAVFVLELLGHLDLDADQLALFGVFIALVILPFVGKLKLLGVEYEALKAEASK